MVTHMGRGMFTGAAMTLDLHKCVAWYVSDDGH